MIQSVSRAVTILKTIAENPDGIGVSDIARRLNVHKSTASRLISTLEAENVLERLPDGNGFRIGEGLIALMPRESEEMLLAERVVPFMQELADKTGESVGLSVLDGYTTRTVVQLPGQQQIRVSDWTGERFPLHISSSGKHYLSRMGRTELDVYFRSFGRRTSSKEVIQEIDSLEARMLKLRQRRVDWTYDDFEKGLLAVSAPLLDFSGEIVAVIYISAPYFRFPAKPSDTVLIDELLLRVCREASTALNLAAARSR